MSVKVLHTAAFTAEVEDTKGGHMPTLTRPYFPPLLIPTATVEEDLCPATITSFTGTPFPREIRISLMPTTTTTRMAIRKAVMALEQDIVQRISKYWGIMVLLKLTKFTNSSPSMSLLQKTNLNKRNQNR